MSFRVIFRPQAEYDIVVITRWLELRDATFAARWRASFFPKVIEKLEDDPHRYPEAEEAQDLGVDLRELLYGRRRQVYRILFTVTGDTVSVLRVRHAAQDRLDAEDF